MIVFRYLSRELLLTSGAVSAVLLVIIMSGRFIKYLAQAAEGRLDHTVLFLIMAYKLPSFFQLILPLGLFLGVTADGEGVPTEHRAVQQEAERSEQRDHVVNRRLQSTHRP